MWACDRHPQVVSASAAQNIESSLYINHLFVRGQAEDISNQVYKDSWWLVNDLVNQVRLLVDGVSKTEWTSLLQGDGDVKEGEREIQLCLLSP